MPLTLIRHAHTDWNGPPKRFQGRADIGLSRRGKEEARSFGLALSPPDRIISSPARRCVETVAGLFGDESPPVTLEPRLWEIDTGRFTGMLEDEISEEDPKFWRLWRTTPSQTRFGSAETLSGLQRRTLAALREIIGTVKENERLLIVTHGGPIKVLMCFLTDRSLDDYRGIVIENLQQFVLSPEQLSRICNSTGI